MRVSYKSSFSLGSVALPDRSRRRGSTAGYAELVDDLIDFHGSRNRRDAGLKYDLVEHLRASRAAIWRAGQLGNGNRVNGRYLLAKLQTFGGRATGKGGKSWRAGHVCSRRTARGE